MFKKGFLAIALVAGLSTLTGCNEWFSSLFKCTGKCQTEAAKDPEKKGAEAKK